MAKLTRILAASAALAMATPAFAADPSGPHHIVKVYVTVWTTSTPDVAKDRVRVVATPDFQYPTEVDCQEALRNDSAVNAALVAKTMPELRAFVESSTEPGHLKSEWAKIRCYPVSKPLSAAWPSTKQPSSALPRKA